MAKEMELQITKVTVKNSQMWLTLSFEKRYAGTLHVTDTGFIAAFFVEKPRKLVLPNRGKDA